MKNKSLLLALAACALTVTFTACDKKTPVEKATDTITDAAAKNAAAAKDMAGKAAATVVTNVMSEVSSPYNDGLAAAKKFIANKDYKSALTELNKLSSMKLSDEQTKVVDGLKAEVQKLIAGGSASTVDAAKGLFSK